MGLGLLQGRTWAPAGITAAAIWSLGHREIADNLDENGWKIAVFSLLPPAPSFFSYFLFYFLLFHLFPSSHPLVYTRRSRTIGQASQVLPPPLSCIL